MYSDCIKLTYFFKNLGIWLHPSLMSLRFTQKIMKNQQKNIDLCQSYIWLQNNKGDQICFRTEKRVLSYKTNIQIKDSWPQEHTSFSPHAYKGRITKRDGGRSRSPILAGISKTFSFKRPRITKQSPPPNLYTFCRL